MSEKLRPCPFCKSKEPDKVKLVCLTSNMARVVCSACGAAGPFTTGPAETVGEQAKAAWNNRGEKSVSPDEDVECIYCKKCDETTDGFWCSIKNCIVDPYVKEECSGFEDNGEGDFD